ncbi:MAG: 1-deoxy-D-xylulose-5-phosphate synthase [Acholeplasmatales bacterium]|nr:1-deoxy-D-xylulose-5-phosphate synthase [Acholeplasmatales bacterium]
MEDFTKFKDPLFIKTFNVKSLNVLSVQIRDYLVKNILLYGGHLSSNLGVVDLSIALYYSFDHSKDIFLFDTGHQCYTSKILSGRNDFENFRTIKGLSGFPSPKEDPSDQFITGHAGSILAAQNGYLIDDKNNNLKREVISVIGDASIINGMAFEGLNILSGRKDLKGIIILNDNNMGISKTVSGFSFLLMKLRGSAEYRFIKRLIPGFIRNIFKHLAIKNNLFEDLGFAYIGPFDGHNLKDLIKAFNLAKKYKKSVVIHVLTKKGYGYQNASTDPEKYHGISKTTLSKEYITFSDGIARIITMLNTNENPIYVVSSGMSYSSGFKNYSINNKNYFIDTGIAEELSATLASVLATKKRVFLSYYSVFSQRAYDQILNDIALNNSHLVIGLDRAGLVPGDGKTHQGIFDIGMFSALPNVIITSPYDLNEAYNIISSAFNFKKITVVRYPKDVTLNENVSLDNNFSFNWSIFQDSDNPSIVIISYGKSLDMIKEVVTSNNINALIINARIIWPLDKRMLYYLHEIKKKVIVYEEQYCNVNLYTLICEYLIKEKLYLDLIALNIKDYDIPSATKDEMLEYLHLDKKSLLEVIKNNLN